MIVDLRPYRYYTPRLQSGGGADGKVPLYLACSQLDSDLAVTTKASAFTINKAMDQLEVFIDVSESPVGSDIIVDITKNAVSIFSTKVSIDAGEKTSRTATTPYALSSDSFAIGDEVVVKIDQVGSTTPGKDLVLTLYGRML